MSAVGRWSAIGAAVFAVITAATWSQAGTPTVAQTGLDGAQLFLARGCSGCHVGPDSTPMIGAGFPSLADASDWAADRRANLSAEDYLKESIVAPDAFISPELQTGQSGPATGMPQLRLSSGEVDALVEYLLGR